MYNSGPWRLGLAALLGALWSRRGGGWRRRGPGFLNRFHPPPCDDATLRFDGRRIRFQGRRGVILGYLQGTNVN